MYKKPEQRTRKCSCKNLKRGKEEVPGERKWRLSKTREVESLSEK